MLLGRRVPFNAAKPVLSVAMCDISTGLQRGSGEIRSLQHYSEDCSAHTHHQKLVTGQKLEQLTSDLQIKSQVAQSQ